MLGLNGFFIGVIVSVEGEGLHVIQCHYQVSKHKRHSYPKPLVHKDQHQHEDDKRDQEVEPVFAGRVSCSRGGHGLIILRGQR